MALTLNLEDDANTAARSCRRFWVPRGAAPDLSDEGFLFDPDSPRATFRGALETPFERLMAFPVLALLGEPGIGKSTALEVEAGRLRRAAQQSGDLILFTNLAACGTDITVNRNTFESRQFRAWRKGKRTLYLLLDGFDTCLQSVPTLVELILEHFALEARERLRVRMACRTTEWPADLEDGLHRLWAVYTPTELTKSVGIFELAPLRKIDVRDIARSRYVRSEDFLKEVNRLSAAQFANRPITLQFLLNAFRKAESLPSRKTDLYREGCLVLCDEWREDRRRGRQTQRLSSGQRFAVASRVAAVTIFSRRTAIWTASREKPILDGDVRIDELFGGDEAFGRETIRDVGANALREAADTGLFRSVGPYRLGFSHQTYAEYLAAQYLVDHQLPASEILRLILHPDGSGKVVPQLRETAAWLAALVPEVCTALLSGDPTTLFASDTPPSSEDEKRELVQQMLRLYDSGDLLEINIVSEAGRQQEGARLKYGTIATDLKPYIVDKSRRAVARLVAIMMARFT